MANFNSDHINQLTQPVSGQPLLNRIPTNQSGGRIRYAEMQFVAPSSGTAPAIGDKIIWGRLPVKARIIAALSRILYNAGTASCTANLGDQFLATRYLAATAINAAGSTALSEATMTALADNTVGSAVLTACKAMGIYKPGALITGTGVATAATVVSVDLAGRSVVMSLVATSSNTQTTITGQGSTGTYETQDDSSNAANAWASATDDCTLISTIAGAQVANNQVIQLRVAYVHD
jgi:hypothetical protein